MKGWPRRFDRDGGGMRIFVTGAQGFVGRYYVAHALRESHSAVVMGVGRSARSDDVFTHRVRWGSVSIAAPLPAALRREIESDRYQYEAVDLRDRHVLTGLLRSFEPDAIVHMASGLRDDDPEHLFATNVMGAMTLVDAIAQAAPRVKIVVLGSTGGVYGVPAKESLPLSESAPCNPVDLYSASKLSSEHATRIVAARAGVPVVWARLFNLVGPGQDERHVCGRFAAQAAAIARDVLPPRIEVGNLDATRDFIDVRDIARGIEALIAAGTPGSAYNVASGIETSIGEVLTATLRSAGIEGRADIVKLPPRAEDIPRHFADVGKMSALGFRPSHALADSIGAVVDYYLEEAAALAR
jgi:nucleoside-diphosphate-sugar epimerase